MEGADDDLDQQTTVIFEIVLHKADRSWCFKMDDPSYSFYAAAPRPYATSKKKGKAGKKNGLKDLILQSDDDASDDSPDDVELREIALVDWGKRGEVILMDGFECRITRVKYIKHKPKGKGYSGTSPSKLLSK